MKKNVVNKRQHERFKLPYVIKFRCAQTDSVTEWDAVNPIDMSDSDISFFTVDRFIPGSSMQLLVTNSILKEERVYSCRVFRSDKSKSRSMFYQTVVMIENMDADAKEAYLKV